MTDFHVREALPRELAEHWATVEPLFARALAADPVRRFDPVDLLAAALQGGFKPWFAVDAESGAEEIHGVMLTQIQSFPRARTCNAYLVAGGRMREWLAPWLAAIERHARDEGCAWLEAEGRDGWERATGAMRAGTRFVKELR